MNIVKHAHKLMGLQQLRQKGIEETRAANGSEYQSESDSKIMNLIISFNLSSSWFLFLGKTKLSPITIKLKFNNILYPIQIYMHIEYMI